MHDPACGAGGAVLVVFPFIGSELGEGYGKVCNGAGCGNDQQQMYFI